MTSLTSDTWIREELAGVPVRSLPPDPDSPGVVLILPEAGWPDAPALTDLEAKLRQVKLGAVMVNVHSWWIDQAEPSIPGAASPLMFIAEQLAPWMAGRWQDPSRLAALGVGLGGQGALQLAYRFPHLFPIAAGVTPAIDFHRLYDSSTQLQNWFQTQERARQETATLRLHPLNWPPHQWFACPRGDWRFDGCERLASKLTSTGIPFTVDLETPEEPRYREKQLAAAIHFISERLREPVVSRDIRVSR